MHIASRRIAHASLLQHARSLRRLPTVRSNITTLAIETSCDDTSVAVIDVDGDTQQPSSRNSQRLSCRVKYHRTITAKTEQYGGIHPVIALESHHANVADLVAEARQCLVEGGALQKPTFVSATRGPGMRSSLAAGLMLAKGLATAWDVPLVGVHHMQAHALTPRLCSVLDSDDGSMTPRFPYLTVLASGGHTMLVRSIGLVDHQILAETPEGMAIGDCLDKAARAVLPPDLLTAPYGRALEEFAFPDGAADYEYTAPKNRGEELKRHVTPWRWALTPPLSQSGSGDKSPNRMMFSFGGLSSSLHRLVQHRIAQDGSPATGERSEGELGIDERREMARQILRVSFEHLISRVLLYLTNHKDLGIDTVVVSGGVAANRYLRHVLRSMLDARGFSHLKTVFPPPSMCTDNALMIAWAGMEMYQAGYRSMLDILPIRKWSMDNSVNGGILGAGGWTRD